MSRPSPPNCAHVAPLDLVSTPSSVLYPATDNAPSTGPAYSNNTPATAQPPRQFHGFFRLNVTDDDWAQLRQVVLDASKRLAAERLAARLGGLQISTDPANSGLLSTTDRSDAEETTSARQSQADLPISTMGPVSCCPARHRLKKACLGCRVPRSHPSWRQTKSSPNSATDASAVTPRRTRKLPEWIFMAPRSDDREEDSCGQQADPNARRWTRY